MAGLNFGLEMVKMLSGWVQGEWIKRNVMHLGKAVEGWNVPYLPSTLNAWVNVMEVWAEE